MLSQIKGLKPLRLSEYLLLVLYAFVLPFSWRIATFVMIAIFCVAVFKGIFESGFKIKGWQFKNKIACIIFIAFWTIYAISFLYSENSAEARFQIGKKLSFLLFPIYFICSDLSYLTKERIRVIMRFFVYGILALFYVNVVLAGYDVLFEGVPKSRLYDPLFLELGTGYIHHTYVSLYICFAIAVCFEGIFANKSTRSVVFNIVAIISLLAFILISKSRAGQLCVMLVFVILWIWLTFVKKKKKVGLIAGTVMIALVGLGIALFPKSIEKVSHTIANLQNPEREDIRISIYKSCKDLMLDNFWFGVGVGDRSDNMMDCYIKTREDVILKVRPVNDMDSVDFSQNGRDCMNKMWEIFRGVLTDYTFDYAHRVADKYSCDYSSVRENLAVYFNMELAIESNCNIHNQFLDAVISVGVLGMLLLIAIFVLPIYMWVKSKRFDVVYFSLLFVVAFFSMFESTFERQMGIMFFVFFYFILFHASFCHDVSKENELLNEK
ncbi:MAG: O-antigen ligase family protein [Bacteroidales bacterium]|nr:O-antigen ligase family protein [Bacteroidales bacterium]